MRSDTYCKRLFTIGAFWNWSVAILFVALATFALEPLSWFLNEVPESFLWFYLFIALVAVFGVGYYWAGQDVRRNRDIIKMGVLGKSAVLILLIPAWLSGEVTVLVAAAAAVDLIFTILFIDVLRNTAR